MQEFWATAKLHHNSIHFKIDTRTSVLDLEAFREMLHISPRIPNQPFVDLPTEKEVLDFLRFLGHSHDIRYLTDAKALELTVSDCLKLNCFGNSITELTLILLILSGRTLCIRKKKGDSASSTTPPTPTPTTIAESAPRLSASAKGKQPLRAKTPIEPTDLQRIEAEQLKIILKRSRQETHISQQSGSGT
nr:hypothetical protein [Tanacetum cinerariifolium]